MHFRRSCEDIHPCFLRPLFTQSFRIMELGENSWTIFDSKGTSKGKARFDATKSKPFACTMPPNPLLLVPHRTFGSRGKHTDPALASDRNAARGPLKAINPFRAKLAGGTGLRCFAPRILG